LAEITGTRTSHRLVDRDDVVELLGARAATSRGYGPSEPGSERVERFDEWSRFGRREGG
jgi:hypothetical protein